MNNEIPFQLICSISDILSRELNVHKWLVHRLIFIAIIIFAIFFFAFQFLFRWESIQKNKIKAMDKTKSYKCSKSRKKKDEKEMREQWCHWWWWNRCAKVMTTKKTETKSLVADAASNEHLFCASSLSSVLSSDWTIKKKMKSVKSSWFMTLDDWNLMANTKNEQGNEEVHKKMWIRKNGQQKLIWRIMQIKNREKKNI